METNADYTKPLDLTELRGKIDALDNELASLFVRRMALCAEVAAYKKQTAKAVRDASRENAIVARLTDGLSEKDAIAVDKLYRAIFEISRASQQELLTGDVKNSALYEHLKNAMAHKTAFPEAPTVACQGVEGAYSSLACRKLFKQPEILYFKDFEGVFRSVESGLCRYGVLPFENSIHGSVTEVYDRLSSGRVKVAASVKLPIHHALLAAKGASLDDITEIYSHKQAVGQCSDFLTAHRNIKVNICENTAVAAKRVAESGRHDIAALSSEACAALYGLDILGRDLQNSDVNYTMFYCITKNLEIAGEVDKAAFMFNVPNRTGSLADVLGRFAAYGINLIKIESKPICGKDFEFMFYAEADCKGLDEPLVRLLCELSESLEVFHLIGAYKELAPEDTQAEKAVKA